MRSKVQFVVRRLFPVMLFASACVVSVVRAQGTGDYPSKSVSITVPWAPGGGVDILGRLISQSLNTSTGQSVIVENRPGASGVVGSRYVASQPGDGHSLLVMNDTYAITAAMSKNMPFDAKKDIAPVIVVAYAPQLLVTATNSPLNSFADVLKAGQAPNAKMSYGACGAGTPGHLAAESLNIQFNMKILHIPYKGCAPTILDLIGGQLDLAWVTLGAAVGHIKAGKLKPLAVSSSQRSSVLPDVPTMSESGVPGFNFSSWQGLGVPGGTPDNVKRKVHATIANVVKAEAFQKRLVELGYTPANLNDSSSVFQATVVKDIDRFAQIGKQINFSLD